MRILTTLAVVAAATASSVSFAASHADMPREIVARHGLMNVIAINMGTLGGFARGNAEYSAEAAQAAADNLVAASMIGQENLWPAETLGTDQTAALPNIAEDWAGFDEDWADFGTAVAALQAVAGDGLDPMRAAMGDVGKTCGACHDVYRVKNN